MGTFSASFVPHWWLRNAALDTRKLKTLTRNKTRVLCMRTHVGVVIFRATLLLGYSELSVGMPKEFVFHVLNSTTITGKTVRILREALFY